MKRHFFVLPRCSLRSTARLNISGMCIRVVSQIKLPFFFSLPICLFYFPHPLDTVFFSLLSGFWWMLAKEWNMYSMYRHSIRAKVFCKLVSFFGYFQPYMYKHIPHFQWNHKISSHRHIPCYYIIGIDTHVCEYGKKNVFVWLGFVVFPPENFSIR